MVSLADYIYETHIMENKLLPFIFHKDTSVEEDHLFSFNWHENIELLCCTRGSGFVKCNMETFSIQEGDIFVVDSDAVHSTGCNGTFIYDCLIVDQAFCQSNGIPVGDLHFQEVIRDEELYQSFCRAAGAITGKHDSPWAIAQIRYEVLGLLIRLCSGYAKKNPTETGKSVSAERVKKAMTYIRSNLAKPLTLDEIAEVVGISKYHFSREFKALTGETVIDSINILRCKEAKRLIESGMTVSAAAMSCGFENLSYFSRTFKKHFGQLPSKFLAH